LSEDKAQSNPCQTWHWGVFVALQVALINSATPSVYQKNMQFWFGLLSKWPLWALHAVGQLLGWLAWLLSPTYRKRFLENAATAGLKFSQVVGAVGHAGCMSSELPRLWLGRPVPVNWANDSLSVLRQAYAPGKGVLLLTPHLGCFEVTAQAITDAFSQAHGPLTVLYRPSRKAGLADVMESSRGRPGLEPVPTTMAGVRQMIKALRAGRAVGLLPDQVPPLGMGQWAPFFGKPAYTMTLAARLALQTGAQVVLVWGERLPMGRGYQMHVRLMPQALSESLELAVVEINEAMADLILTSPQQYLWGYARYKQPRQED
jgi:KDO2-lipid IV(A) lauroyltransferase